MGETTKKGPIQRLLSTIALVVGCLVFHVSSKHGQKLMPLDTGIPHPIVNTSHSGWTSSESLYRKQAIKSRVRRLQKKGSLLARSQLTKKTRVIEKRVHHDDPPEKRSGQKLVAAVKLRKGGDSKSSKTVSSGGKGGKGKGGKQKSSRNSMCKGKGKGGKGKGGKSSSSDVPAASNVDDDCEESPIVSKASKGTKKGKDAKKASKTTGDSPKATTSGKKKNRKEKKPKGGLSCDDFAFSRRLQDQDFCSPNLLMTSEMLPMADIFFDLLEIADLSDLLICPGPFTVLAPANTAFQALDPALLESLIQPENVEELRILLLQHIVQGSHPGSTLQPGNLTPLAGNTVQAQTNPIMFDDSGVAMTGDILACNGAIHVLDKVIGLGDVPPLPPVSVPPPPTNTPILPPPPPTTNAPILAPPPPTNAPVIAPPPPTEAPVLAPPRQTEAPVIAPPPPTEAPVLAPPRQTEAPVIAPPPPTEAPVLAPPRQTEAPVNPPPPPTEAPLAPPPPPTEAPVVPPPPPTEAPVVPPTVEPTPPPTESPTVAPTIAAVPATPAPTDAPPTSNPTTAPQPVVIRTDDIFMSFFADGATESPTREEYETFVQLTTDYFQEYLEDSFAGDPDRTFLRVESQLGATAFGQDAGIPAERFNIYLDFDFIDIYFEAGSVAPDPANVVSLLKGSITTDYILNIPRMMTGTPFARTREVVLAQTSSIITIDP